MISFFRLLSRLIWIDLEFKLIYVGSAETETHDQVLESLLVGPVPVGVNKFVLEVIFSFKLMQS